MDAEKLTVEIVEKVVEQMEEKGCSWRDLGDIEQNHARVNIVSNPESTIIERITNGMDALLELSAMKDGKIKNATSPREAVKGLLDIKDGYLSNLSQSEETKIIPDKIQVEVFVKVGDGVNLFFRDRGIGLIKEEMPDTILALNSSNKFRKPFLIGQYGQGGSTTCAFSKYSIIITRKAESHEIAFTVIRFNELSDDHLAKDGKYEYLVLNKIPPSIESDGIQFDPGTLVAHLNYETYINKGFINYFQVLDHYLFDPPLPYSLFYDEWKPGSRRNLLGARRRIETSKLNQYKQEYRYKLIDKNFGEVKIRFFLLKRYEEKEKKGKKIREPVQADRYLFDDKHPIVITYNGQVQGNLPRTILKDDCKFGYIYKSLIVQVECDELTAAGKKFFFTSGRDRLKKAAQEEISSGIIDILSKDDYLKAENEAREQESISEQVGKDTTEIRRKLAEMLNKLNPGKFKITLAGQKKIESGSATKSSGGGKKAGLEPLETKEKPSFIKIANINDPIKLKKGRTSRLNIESDAPNGLLSFNEWLLDVNDTKQPRISIHSHSDFTGGRMKIFVKCDESSKIGEIHRVTLRLKHKGGETLTSNERAIKITEPIQADKTGQLEVNAPEIIKLTEKDSLYSQFGWNEMTVAEVKEGSKTTIYVNMSNIYFRSMLKEGRYSEQRSNRIQNQYLLHIAYHSFIQHLGFKENSLNLTEDAEEKIKRAELDRAARTVCSTMMGFVTE
ncbi:hypothetical protein HYU11_03015 [Candidatus Woesearchaeota archaeon]|nr:hypothetical protein [Candidatus Woesearchaeota archaeon]